MPPNSCPTVDLIVSVFNEAETLPAFHAEVCRVIQELATTGRSASLIYVNDGSTDESAVLLDGFATEPHVRVLHLSRNFGHESAMLAGLDDCRADHAVFLDADLQHPPRVALEALRIANAGTDIVLMRRGLEQAGLIRRACNAAFYRGLAAIASLPLEPGASDFFLLGRPVIEVLQHDMRERTRFLRGLVQWVGFRRAVLDFDSPARVAGESKYGLRKLVGLARNATLALSTVPLRMAFVVGCVMLVFCVAMSVVSVVGLLLGNPPSGYTTIMLFSAFVAATQFAILGILGEYIGQLVDEVKGRPVYIVARRTGGCSSDSVD